MEFSVVTNRHYLQVLRSIVESIFVDMVNVFLAFKTTTKNFLHHPSLLAHSALSFFYIAITTMMNCSSAAWSLLSKQWISIAPPHLVMLRAHPSSKNPFCTTANLARHILKTTAFILLLSSSSLAQTIITPVSGVATVDVGTCGQGGGSPNPSCTFKLTLTANTTLAFNNAFGGANVNLFINPSTFTLTWPSSVPIPTPALTASQNNFVSLRYDGTSGTWLLTSGGSGSPAASENAIFAKDKGVIADGLVVYDAGWTSGANPVVVTSATANFLASRDNNKACLGIDSTTRLNTAPLGTLTVVNSTTANCSGSGTATATSSASAFAWGTDDTAAWLAANAAAAASVTPTCIVGPNGNSLISKAPLIDPRTTPTWDWCFSGPTGGLTTFIPEGSSFVVSTCKASGLGSCQDKSWNGTYQFDFVVRNYFPHYPGYIQMVVSFGTQELCEADVWVMEQQQQVSLICPGPAYLVIDNHQPGGGPAQGQNNLMISFTASEGWPVYTNDVSWSFTPSN